MSEKPCFLYIIGTLVGGVASAPTKVGISSNPTARLRELQVGSARKLMLCSMVMLEGRADAFGLEQEMHATLAEWGMSGEWFDVCPLYATGVLFCEGVHFFGMQAANFQRTQGVGALS